METLGMIFIILVVSAVCFVIIRWMFKHWRGFLKLILILLGIALAISVIFGIGTAGEALRMLAFGVLLLIAAIAIILFLRG